MKKLLILLLIINMTACHAQNLSIHNIEGVWSRRQQPGFNSSLEQEFSWKERILPIRYDMLIDLKSEDPTIEFVGFNAPNTVTETIVKDNNIIELTFWFGVGRFDATMVFHFIDDSTMWIEEIRSQDISFVPLGRGNTGRDVLYYRLVGPEL